MYNTSSFVTMTFSNLVICVVTMSDGRYRGLDEELTYCGKLNENASFQLINF